MNGRRFPKNTAAQGRRPARSRFRFRFPQITPPFAVVCGAACIVGLMVVARMINSTGRRATFEAEIVFADRASKEEARHARRATRPEDILDAKLGIYDPSLRLSDRVRDASALALGLSLHLVHERLGAKQVVVSDVSALAREFSGSELLPPGMSFIGAGQLSAIFQTQRGLYFVRYRPRPLMLEILACGQGGLSDGAVFVLRVPDDLNSLSPNLQPASAAPVLNASTPPLAGRFAALWLAPQAQTAAIPLPFAPAENYRQAGWVAEPLYAPQLSAPQTAELTAWLNQSK